MQNDSWSAMKRGGGGEEECRVHVLEEEVHLYETSRFGQCKLANSQHECNPTNLCPLSNSVQLLYQIPGFRISFPEERHKPPLHPSNHSKPKFRVN